MNCFFKIIIKALLAPWVAFTIDVFTHRTAFVCANRCCVISRWPAQCVVSRRLPVSFLIQGNLGVWPDLYSNVALSHKPPVWAFRNSLRCSAKGNWKSAVILTPLWARTDLHTHTYDGEKLIHTPLEHTAKSRIIPGSNPSQMSTLLSPLEAEGWDCLEISCWSTPALREGEGSFQTYRNILENIRQWRAFMS